MGMYDHKRLGVNPPEHYGDDNNIQYCGKTIRESPFQAGSAVTYCIYASSDDANGRVRGRNGIWYSWTNHGKTWEFMS